MYAGDVGEVREACHNKHRFQGGVFCMPEMWARRENRAATSTAFRAVFFVCGRCGRGVRSVPQQTPLSGRCFLYAEDVGEV